MKHLPGPKREDFSTFEEWSYWRRRWSQGISKMDRLYPFQPTNLVAIAGASNPIPISKERAEKPLPDCSNTDKTSDTKG